MRPIYCPTVALLVRRSVRMQTAWDLKGRETEPFSAAEPAVIASRSAPPSPSATEFEIVWSVPSWLPPGAIGKLLALPVSRAIRRAL